MSPKASNEFEGIAYIIRILLPNILIYKEAHKLSIMPSVFTSRGVEVELDSNSFTSTYHESDSAFYTEEEDEVASVSVQAPTRLDVTTDEDGNSDVLRQLADLEGMRRQQSTSDYLKKFPTNKESNNRSKTIQNGTDSKFSTINQASIHRSKTNKNRIESKSIPMRKESIRKGFDDLEAQMKNMHRQMKIENQQKSVIINSKGDGNEMNCIGSFWSNHVVKITILLVVYCLIATAVGGWLVQQFFKIPGLNHEIRDLNKQVDLLKSEVDRLNDVVDRLDDQIDQLEATNSDLEKTKASLETENQNAHELVKQLNDTNEEFKMLNAELQTENTRYFTYTQELNRTVEELVEDLSQSTATRKSLTESLDEYKDIRETLEEELAILSGTTGDLNATVQELNAAIAEFQDENERFRTIVSFLEDEANGVQHSYDELTNALADTILRKSTLAEIGVKERMKSEIAGWECGLQAAFGTHQFTENVNYPIGFLHFDDVIDYVDGKLFVDFCIQPDDFQEFLETEIVEQGESVWTINLADFTRGVNIYTSEVLNYYFPDEDDTNGLDSDVWDAANYECRNLSDQARYSYK